ncbi:MAG: hypothetical protein WD845_16615 [Pirellulales bacterium]
MTVLQIGVRGGLLAGLLACSTMVMAAERTAADGPAAAAVPAAIDLFDAIDANVVDARLIHRDATEANVLITNKTDKPLTVRLPDAFAGVPVLAQRGGGGGGRGGGGSNTSSQQSTGGGMGGGGMGGMGMMNIAPEKVAKLKVTTVCLEHGKKEPRPGIPYEIKPLETVTTQPGVKELLTALGRERVSQRAAQAAAWHLANDMSWEQLANKRIVHLNGTTEMWFSPQEVQGGMQLAHAARVQADQQAADAEPAAPTNKPAIEVQVSQE